MFHKPVTSFPDCGTYRKFGWDKRHTGDDYPAAVGSYVCAVLDGEVVLSQELNGFGSLNPSSSGGCVIVKHRSEGAFSRQFFAVYGHLNRWKGVGAKIHKGDVIGTIRTFSNGADVLPHLHFGIYTGSVLPTSHLGYNDNLAGYHDPDVRLATYATGSNKCIVPSLAEWSPRLFSSSRSE